MSANEQLTPEERLLKVIQQKKGAPNAEQPPVVGAPPPAAPPAAPPSAAPPFAASAPSIPPPAPAAPPPAPPVRDVKVAPVPPREEKIPAPTPAPEAPPLPPAASKAVETRKEEPKLRLAERPTEPRPEKKAAVPVPTPVAPATPPPAATPAAAAPPPAAELPAPLPEVAVPIEPPVEEAEEPVAEPAVPRREMTLGMVNRYLLVIVLVALGLVIYDLASIKTGATAALAPATKTDERPQASAAVKTAALLPLEACLEHAAKRNIFIPGATAAPTNQVVGPVETNLKLMAISLDSAAPAESMAIIADQKANQTYFVKCGQAIGDTGVELQQVLRDRVILKTSKGEMELQ